MIVHRLIELQDRFGYLPGAELVARAEELGVPRARVEEVASFFPTFRREWDRPAAVEIRICQDMSCHLRGAGELLEPRLLPAIAAGLTAETGLAVRVSGVSCLGRCDRAPALWVERQAADGPEAPRVYCARDRKTLGQTVRRLVSSRPADPDGDAMFETNTNAGRGYSPAPRPGELRAPNWEVDPYARDGRPPNYAAVRRYVQHVRPPAAGRSCARADRRGPRPGRRRSPPLPGRDEGRECPRDGRGRAPAYGKWLDVWLQAGPEKLRRRQRRRASRGRPWTANCSSGSRTWSSKA